MILPIIRGFTACGAGILFATGMIAFADGASHGRSMPVIIGLALAVAGIGLYFIVLPGRAPDR